VLINWCSHISSRWLSIFNRADSHFLIAKHTFSPFGRISAGWGVIDVTIGDKGSLSGIPKEEGGVGEEFTPACKLTVMVKKTWFFWGSWWVQEEQQLVDVIDVFEWSPSVEHGIMASNPLCIVWKFLN
jgi:hypothetical protein